MNTLELARLQFGITTLFHFIFVPMSIGLATWVAFCQTRWYRTGDEVYLRMTRFWGKLMLISLAIGVVTGIVQEFQFGMNWSQYSRYVGDIFGAPLAMEGLAAFFLESTFIGLWLFGWNKLSPKLHLATIWLTAFGTVLSAYFILAANSWMQHPVGYHLNTVAHQAELTSIFKVLTNSTVLLAFPHTVFGAMLTAGMLVLGISAFGLLRGRSVDVYRRSVRRVLPFTLVAAMGTGDLRPRPGHADGDPAADEDGCRRGALQDHQGRQPLGLRRRALPTPPGTPQHRHPDPAPAVDHRHRLVERRGQGDQPDQPRRAGQIRPRRLRADHRHHLLDVPPDGGCRRPAAPDPADRTAAVEQRHARAQPLVPAGPRWAASPCRSSPT